MGAGCTKPLDNIVEARDFGRDFMHNDSDHSGFVEEADGAPPQRSPSRSASRADDTPPSTTRSRNRGGVMRVVRHIQEAGNYTDDSDFANRNVRNVGRGPDESISPPPLPQGVNVNASPRRHQNIVHEGSSESSFPKGLGMNTYSTRGEQTRRGGYGDEGGVRADDEYSDASSTQKHFTYSHPLNGGPMPGRTSTTSKGYVAPLQAHFEGGGLVGQNNGSAVKEDETLLLVMSRDNVRRTRRNNLKLLNGFSSANTRLRQDKERRYKQPDRASQAGGRGECENRAEGHSRDVTEVTRAAHAGFIDDTVRTDCTASNTGGIPHGGAFTVHQRAATRGGLGFVESSEYYSTGARNSVGSARGIAHSTHPNSMKEGLVAVKSMASAPVSPDRDFNVNARGAQPLSARLTSQSRDGQGVSGVNGVQANAIPVQKGCHRHHHYSCHVAKTKRLRKQWLHEALAIYCPHLQRPSFLMREKGVTQRRSTERIVASGASGPHSELLARRMGVMRTKGLLLDGEGYNSEAPSETARRQWKRTQKYKESVFSRIMTNLYEQRKSQRKKVRQEILSRSKSRAQRIATPTNGEWSLQEFNDQYDSSASCSSYDAFEDQLATAERGVFGGDEESSTIGKGYPRYSKPLWASDAAAGVLSAQYDLLARVEQRRRTAEVVMRTASVASGVVTILPIENDAILTKRLDAVFPHSVPLRQYTASKTAAQDGRRSTTGRSLPSHFRGTASSFQQPAVSDGVVTATNTLLESSSCSSSWSSGSSVEELDITAVTGSLTRASGAAGIDAQQLQRGGGILDEAGVSRRDDSSQSSSTSESSSDDRPNPRERLQEDSICICSDCSCTAYSSSSDFEVAFAGARGVVTQDSLPLSGFHQTHRDGSSSTSGASASCNEGITQNAQARQPIGGKELLDSLPKHIRDSVYEYIAAKEKSYRQTLRVLSSARGQQSVAASSRGKRRGTLLWLNWLRWSVFRKGAAWSRSFLGIAASLKCRLGTASRKHFRGARKNRAGSDCAAQDGIQLFNEASQTKGGNALAEAYYSGLFRRRYVPLNLSSRVPFLENYQARFFRITSAAELHRGIIHPFAVDPPLLVSCAKDLKGEAKDSPHPPTLVTISAVEALIAGVSSLVAASTSLTYAPVAGDIHGSLNSNSCTPQRSSQPAAKSTSGNLINRPVLSSSMNPQLSVPGRTTNTTVQALQQLLQELKQGYKTALAQAKAHSTEVHLLLEYQHAYLQEKETLYRDIVRTLAHLRQSGDSSHSVGQAPAQGLPYGGSPSAGLNHPLGMNGAAGLASNSYVFSSTLTSSSQIGIGCVPSANGFPSVLLTEETERHINSVLFRRYGLLLAGSSHRTVDLHRFITLISPAILRYKLVHTNASFVKEARTLQETKAAERAKQAEAHQQAQKALQQQQEQQRLLQQQLMMQQRGPSANQPVYVEFQGGSLGALAAASDNSLISPNSVPGVLPGSQPVIMMISQTPGQAPVPMLCYIIIVSVNGLNQGASGVVLHYQQALQLQQQIQIQHQQQQIALMQLQQQQGGALNTQQQQQLFQLQQEQQQLALVMGAVVNQQQMLLSIGGTSSRQSTVPPDSKQASAAAPTSINTSVPWQVPSFAAVMEGAKLLPSILYLQSSDVLFGTTRTVRHAVSVPTRVCVVTANRRLGDCLSRRIVDSLALKGASTWSVYADEEQCNAANVPRWLRQYAFPDSRRLGVHAYHEHNGHVNPEGGALPKIAVPLAQDGAVPEGFLEGASPQIELRHTLHGYQQSPYHPALSLSMPHTTGMQHVGILGGVSRQSHTPFVSISSCLAPTGKVLESRIVQPYTYVNAMKMGEMALRHWARRTQQYHLLNQQVSLGPTSLDRGIDAVALAEVYCSQQENVLAKQLSRLGRSNSCEVVSLHPSLLRKKMGREERRRRKALIAREPLKRAGTGGGGLPQPLQQLQQIGGQGQGAPEATKAKSASAPDKPLFSREAISVVVLQQGGSALSSDPLMAAWHQRLAKSLLKTRHSVVGMGAQSLVFSGLLDEQSEVEAVALSASAGKEAGLNTARDVPSTIIMSQHLGSHTEAMVAAAACSGLLSCRNSLERDAMRPASAYNASEFLAHCIADFTIHNEHMYRHANVKGGPGGAANAQQGNPSGSGAASTAATNTAANSEVSAQRSIAKALLTGVRLGYMRAVEIMKLSAEATNDELAFSANRLVNLQNKTGPLLPRTVGGERFGVNSGRSVQHTLGANGPSASPIGRSYLAPQRGRRTSSSKSPQPSGNALQLEARIAVMQQQCRYVADKTIYAFSSIHRYSFTDYPALMLSLLLREGVLTGAVVNTMIAGSGGSASNMPHCFSLPSIATAPLPASAPQLSTPRSTLQTAQVTAAALSSSGTGPSAPLTTFVIPSPLLDSLLPSFYHHPLTSPITVANSCVLQTSLSSDMQSIVGLCLTLPAGSPPPTAAALSMAPIPTGLPQHQHQPLQQPSKEASKGGISSFTSWPPSHSPQPHMDRQLNDTALARAKFANHGILAKAMATLMGPSSPTSASTIYVRDNKLFCATVGHHTASVLFNISPLAQHVVQNALNIRQQFAKTLAAQLTMLQHVQPPQTSLGFVLNTIESSGGSHEEAKRQHGTVINMQPLQANLRAFLFKGTSLTNLVLGDDIRYRYQSTRATGAAAYNTKLSAAVSVVNSSAGSTSAAGQQGNKSPALGPIGGGSVSTTKVNFPAGVPPSAFVDINAFKTQQSVVPAGCCGQLFVPLSSLPDLSLSGRQARIRNHNRTSGHQRRSGSSSSLASSTGSMMSSIHSSSSRQDSTQSDRRGVVGESNTLASAASSASSSGSVSSSNRGGVSGERALSSVSLKIPNRSALRAVNDLVTSSRQAASWLGVQLAATTFTRYETHDCISPNLKLPLPATTPVGPSVCITTAEVSSIFSQAPVPCAPSQPSFLMCNPPPSTSMLAGGALPALRGVPSPGLALMGADDSHVSLHTEASSSIPAKPPAAISNPQLPTLVTVAGPRTVFHRLPAIPELVIGNPQANNGNPALPDPLFANALATVSSVGNLAYTVQTTVHSKSSLSPNFTILTASTDTWMAISPEEMSMFLSMLCPPDWANHGASTNSFLSVMLAAKVDFGSADIRGPFVYDRRRSYMSHHSPNSSAAAQSNSKIPSPWTPCSLGASGVLASPGFLAANGVGLVADLSSSGASEFVPPPAPPMVPTLPHPSTVTPASTHYTSYFLSQTYCDVFGPCDYVRGYINSSSVGLRGLLEVLSRGYSVTSAQLSSIALQQHREQMMGKAPLPTPVPPSGAANAPAAPRLPTAPNAASTSSSGVSPAATSNYNISAPDACTALFEVLSLLGAFSDLSIKVLSPKTNVPYHGNVPLLSPHDRLRIHHMLYSAKIMLAYGDYYHAGIDGEALGSDGSAKTENSWYWEELADFETCLGKMCSNIEPSVAGEDRPFHINIEFPAIPPPPPVHVRLYRRFREKQADLLYHQVLKGRIEAHKKAYDDQVKRGDAPPPSLTEKELEKANGPATAPQTAPPTPCATTDPMLKTSPSTQGGDDFRNAASVLSEIVAEDAAALDRICLHYRLVKDILRRRRASRLRLLATHCVPSTTAGSGGAGGGGSGSGGCVVAVSQESQGLLKSFANHLTACEQPIEGYEFLVRCNAPEMTNTPQHVVGAVAVGNGAGLTTDTGLPQQGSAPQIPITVAGASSVGVGGSGSSSLGSPYSLVNGVAEALTAAHFPSRASTDSESSEPVSSTITTQASYHGLTYSQPRHYVAQILAFK